MFSKSDKGVSIKDIIRKNSSPEELVVLEDVLRVKTDEETLELIKQDLLSTDSKIIDRLNMQKTGKNSTSSDPFVRGLSFYLFSILDDEQVQNKFLSDLKQLEQFKPLQSTIASIQMHIEEYKKGEQLQNKSDSKSLFQGIKSSLNDIKSDQQDVKSDDSGPSLT